MRELLPSPSRASDWWRVPLALTVLIACIAGCLFASAPAFAVFSRPFLGEIKGTPTGEHGELVPFDRAGGITTELVNSEYWWIGEEGAGIVDQFSPLNTFISPQLFGFSPHSLAYDDMNGRLESAGREEWVAVDNSQSVTDNAKGDIYRAHAASSIDVVGRVSRETSTHDPDPFSCLQGIAEKYIENGELVGKPTERWEPTIINPVAGVAVDSSDEPSSAGDIYVIDHHNNSNGEEEIDQFTSAGCFIQAFTMAGSPLESFGENSLEGIAIDPTTGDVVIAENKQSGTKNEHAVIDELTSAGEYLGQLTGISPSSSGTDFGRVPFNDGIAINAKGDLYVGNAEAYVGNAEANLVDVVDEFGAGADYPTVVTGEVANNQGKAVTLTGTVQGATNSVGRDLELSGCEFEYVTEAVFQESISEGKDGFSTVTPEDKTTCVPSPVGQRLKEGKNYPVHADVAGLKSGTIYDYRLVATTNPSEHGSTKYGEVESFAAAASPTVEAVSVGKVSSSFADFSAKINPLGSDTTYHFEYIDATEYEMGVAEGETEPYAAGVSVPVPAADIGAGDRRVSVSVQAGGLSPGTTYDYRLVAVNGVGVTESGNEQFLTVPAGLQGLPDGRAYEMVTPVSKGDAEDMFGKLTFGHAPVNTDVGYSSEDGEHFLLLTEAALGPFAVSGPNAYVFSRGESGWSFKSVESPSLGVQTVESIVFDPTDFSMVGIQDLLTAPQGARLEGLVGEPGGPYTTIGGAETAVGAGSPFELVGASKNLSDLILQGADHELHLCTSGEEATEKELDSGSDGLYQWSSSQRCLSLVDVKSGSAGGGRLISECGAGLGMVGVRSGVAHDAVSADGSRIFFTAPEPGFEGRGQLSGAGCWNGGTNYTPQLYMRVNGETIEVSQPEGATPKTTYPAIYVGASENGSRVFFMTRTELTKSAEDLHTEEPELYEYNVTGSANAPNWWERKLVRISGGESEVAVGKVLDVPAVSADGSAVYFNAEGNLAAGASAGGLYRYDTETGKTQYVGLPQGYPNRSSAKSGVDPLGRWYERETKELVAGLDLEAPYFTTRNGQFLLYGPYRYDAAGDGSTVCAMCNPDGSGPVPDASFIRSEVERENPAGGPTKGMTEDGECVFFDTAESLVPQDTNGELDVYEWEAPGAYGCKLVSGGDGCQLKQGCTYLVSSGLAASNSYFLDSSAYVNSDGEVIEGGNIFFGTHAKLVPQDTDEEGDLYDARIGGGFANSTGPGACEGDACDNPPPAPVFQTPASVTVTGDGNLAGEQELNSPASTTKTTTKKTTPKCKRGFVKKKSRCVRRRSKKQAKKSSRNRRTK
jgi:hypothetical protein